MNMKLKTTLVALLAFIMNAALMTQVYAVDIPTLDVRVTQVTAAKSDTDSISIPRSALTSRNGIPGVFVVDNNEARFRMVRAGRADDKQVKILSGLFGNETLVISDLETVHDGSPVNILE